MRQPRCSGLATFVLLAGVAWAQPEAPKTQAAVTAVRAWPAAGASRIVIELSAESKFSYQRLGNPARIFLDIRDAALKMGGRGPHVVKVDDALVNRVRVAQKDSRVVRVVLDLTEAPSEYQVSQLESPSRVIIEVRPKGGKPAEVSAAPAPAKDEPAAAPVKTVAAAPVKPEPAAPAPVEPAPTTAPARSAPQPARRLSNGQRDMTRVLGLKLGRVLIDPGHGGHDQGTAGPAGLLEKELVLDVSLRLGQLLREQGVAEVRFTREKDEYVVLEERPAMAMRARADLFLSIHANSSQIRNISGAETFFLNFTSVKADLEVAARENASTQKSMFELRELLQKIALKDKMDESREFAARVQASMAGLWRKSNATSSNRGVKKAPFVVLIGASMPSILAEIGFISNPKDEALMKTPEFRQQMAEALAEGVVKYAETLSRTEVARKQTP